MQHRCFEFGPFRLDVTNGLLLRDGQHIPLAPKTFETLVALVEGSGRVLGKEELIQRVWPDTFVEEINLTKNISLLRKMLAQGSDEPFIETIPKRGYRFVAEVKGFSPSFPAVGNGLRNERISRDAAPEPHAGMPTSREHAESTSSTPTAAVGRPELPGVSWVAAAGLVIGVGILGLYFARTHLRPPDPPPSIIPFTTSPGRETHAAFSPSGNQIAYVWSGENGENADIYVKLLGDSQPLRLTTDPGADTLPAWSPDGKSIVFLRQSSTSAAYFRVPALGGPERRLTEVFPFLPPQVGNGQYYSPDGKLLAIVDTNSLLEPSSIFMFGLENRERTKLTSPPVGTLGDCCPAFSPDGRTVAFIRAGGMAAMDLYRVELPQGEPVRLTYDNTAIHGVAWSADGHSLVFASRRGSVNFGLWQIGDSGGTSRRLITIGNNVSSPAVARQGNRMAYTQSLDDQNIWKVDLHGSGGRGSPTNCISSTRADYSPTFSPDGRKIAFVSHRSGGYGVWTSDNNGKNSVLIVDRGLRATGKPSWSPDGSWIAFDSSSGRADAEANFDIFMVRSSGGLPRRLTTDPQDDVAPNWSRDGKWIYFGSRRRDGMQLWKLPVGGGEPVRVSKHGGFEGAESADGRTLYFTRGRFFPGVWRVPVEGGDETLVLDTEMAGYWRQWAIAQNGLYFATAVQSGSPAIRYFEFLSGNFSTVLQMDKHFLPLEPGLSVSQDGRRLLFVQLDQSRSDIALVENQR